MMENTMIKMILYKCLLVILSDDHGGPCQALLVTRVKIL